MKKPGQSYVFVLKPDENARRALALLATIALALSGCTHTQRPEARVHVVSTDAIGVREAEGAGGSGHDCQQEHEECMERCWNRRYPWPHGEKQSGWYYEKCVKDCRALFVECEEEQEKAHRDQEKTLSFPNMEQATSWLREHKGKLTLGTIVLVGGVAFALAVSPAGWLILIPVAATAA